MDKKKSQLIKLTFSYIKEKRLACVKLLNCEEVVLLGDCVYERITPDKSENFERLKSDLEEAATKLTFHTMDVLAMSHSNVCKVSF